MALQRYLFIIIKLFRFKVSSEEKKSLLKSLRRYRFQREDRKEGVAVSGGIMYGVYKSRTIPSLDAFPAMIEAAEGKRETAILSSDRRKRRRQRSVPRREKRASRAPDQI